MASSSLALAGAVLHGIAELAELLAVFGLSGSCSVLHLVACSLRMRPPAGAAGAGGAPLLAPQPAELQQPAAQLPAPGPGGQLPRVQSLWIDGCRGGGGSRGEPGAIDAELAHLLLGLPRMRKLVFKRMEFLAHGLPSCVVDRTALRQLALYDCQLAGLPAGPYLAGEALSRA